MSTVTCRSGSSADGRCSAGVKAWLEAGSLAWLCGVQVVEIEPSAAFRRAIAHALPHAAVSVDHFYADVVDVVAARGDERGREIGIILCGLVTPVSFLPKGSMTMHSISDPSEVWFSGPLAPFASGLAAELDAMGYATTSATDKATACCAPVVVA